MVVDEGAKPDAAVVADLINRSLLIADELQLTRVAIHLEQALIAIADHIANGQQ